MIESLDHLRAVARELGSTIPDAELAAAWERFVNIKEIVALAEAVPGLAGRCVWSALMIERGDDPAPIITRLRALANGGRPALQSVRP